MIKKAIYVFLALFLINILVRDVFKPNIILSQAQWQDNQIKAQSYLYSDSVRFDNIIVGSSMAKSLIADSLNDLSFCNLYFAGESPKEGLDLILKKGIFPQRVFIEVNRILKIDDSGFFDILYNPVLYPLREEVPVLRDGKQPLPLLTTLVETNITTKLIPERFSFFSNEHSRKNNFVLGADPDSAMAEQNEKQLKAIGVLEEYIRLLEEQKVTIIFFEMPSDIVNCKSDEIPDYRKVINRLYSPDKYLYMPNPECGLFKTNDGMHLIGDDIIRYTHYFKTQADSLIQKDK